MPPTVLITGANRGIGLGLTQEYLARGAKVFATCRRPDAASELTGLRGSCGHRLVVDRLDVTRDESVSLAAQRVWAEADRLDVLINNAGIFPEPAADTRLRELELQDCRDAFDTNVVGVLRVTRALLPLLEKGAPGRVANISSGVGCIATKTGIGYYAYGTSKAALNYASRALAAELKERGIIVIVINPGWVKTDIGGAAAELQPAQSAKGIVETVASLGADDNGCWFNWDGQKRLEW